MNTGTSLNIQHDQKIDVDRIVSTRTINVSVLNMYQPQKLVSSNDCLKTGRPLPVMLFTKDISTMKSN